MRFALLIYALVAAVTADVSHLPLNNYLPPQSHNSYSHGHYGAASGPEAQFAIAAISAPASALKAAASAPAVSYQAPASIPSHVHHHTTYSAPVTRKTHHAQVSQAPAHSYYDAASAPAATFEFAASAPAVTYQAAASAPVSVNHHTTYSTPAVNHHVTSQAPITTHHTAASAPAATFDITASAPAVTYQAAAFVPAPVHPHTTYSAPVHTHHTHVSHSPVHTYHAAATVPAVTFVSKAFKATAPTVAYQAAASAPTSTYSAIAPVVTYQTSASEPSHFFSFNSQASPATTYHADASGPVATFSGDASLADFGAGVSSQFQSYGDTPSFSSTDFESEASEPAPAHTYSATDGYHYKSPHRARRRRSPANVPSNDYLPPHHGAASAPVEHYVASPSQSFVAIPALAVHYEEIAPAASYEYDAAAFEPAPAHSFSSADGYRHRNNRRRVYRRHR